MHWCLSGVLNDFWMVKLLHEIMCKSNGSSVTTLPTCIIKMINAVILKYQKYFLKEIITCFVQSPPALIVCTHLLLPCYKYFKLFSIFSEMKNEPGVIIVFWNRITLYCICQLIKCNWFLRNTFQIKKRKKEKFGDIILRRGWGQTAVREPVVVGC